jgi:hypothetical protein
LAELKTRQSENELSSKLIDWILYDLPYLRERCEEIMPKTGASIVMFHPKTKSMVRSKIEIVACKRATLTSVLDAVERGIRLLPKELKTIYRMKYRAGKSERQVAKDLHFHYNTIHQKNVQVRDSISLQLLAIPGSHIREFLLQKWTDFD